MKEGKEKKVGCRSFKFVPDSVNLRPDLLCSALRKVLHDTMCPRSSAQFQKVSYYIKWVTTSWTYSMTCRSIAKR